MNRLIFIGVVVSIMLILVILWLIRSRRLQERHAILWLVGACVIVILGVSSGALSAVSSAVGIAYPPSALFLIVVGFLGLALLDAVVTISRLTDRVRTLAQRVALLDERLEALTRKSGPGAIDAPLPVDGDQDDLQGATQVTP